METFKSFFLQLSGPDHPFLHRLAQYFQHRTLEFRQFVQEKHSILSQADLPGLGEGAAFYKARICNKKNCRGGNFRQKIIAGFAALSYKYESITAEVSPVAHRVQPVCEGS
jgi:hypothetical protein